MDVGPTEFVVRTPKSDVRRNFLTHAFMSALNVLDAIADLHCAR
jgi:hypothetical protein